MTSYPERPRGPTIAGRIAAGALALAAAAHADTLRLGSANGAPASTIGVPVTLSKDNPVVGVQFDLRYPAAYVTTASGAVTGGTDHTLWTGALTNGRDRVIVYSRSNAELPTNLVLTLGAVLGAASPSGGPSLAIENIVFSDAQGNQHPAGVRYTFVEQWRHDHFTSDEREDPVLIGDDRDPDGDGVVNLIEASGARDPHTPDSVQTGLSAVPVAPGGAVRLALRFLQARDPAAAADLATTPGTGTSLFDWTTNGVAVAPTGGGDASAAEMEASVVTTNAHRYLRVTVERRDAP